MMIEDCLKLHDNRPFSLIYETSIETTNCAFNIRNYLINVDVIPKITVDLVNETYEKCFVESYDKKFSEIIRRSNEKNLAKLCKNVGKCVMDINNMLFLHKSIDFIKNKQIEVIKDFNNFFAVKQSEKIDCKLLLCKELKSEEIFPIFNKILKIS